MIDPVSFERKVQFSWRILKYSLVITLLGLGLDHMLYLTTDWTPFLTPQTLSYFPEYSARQVFFGLGILEIVMGFLMMTSYTRSTAYCTAFWFFSLLCHGISIQQHLPLIWALLPLTTASLVLGRLSGLFNP